MCRLMAYVGQPQLLADIVLWPDRSIIKQSYDARERKIDPTLPFHLGHGNLNGDGFGIGWFSTEERRERDPTPCVFTSITPAWNNENLSRLACKIVSPLVFAHVRAAYPGMPVSEQNCHPFQFSRYMWMHNGVVAGFAQIRRSLLEALSDCAYNAVQSFHSDSAVSFALFLNHLPDIRAQQPPDVLIKAMQDTIATISAIQRRHGITGTSLLNYVVSDGTTLIATRFVSPESEGPASLYYAEGASFARTQQPAPPSPAPSAPAPQSANGGGCGGGGPQPGQRAAAPPCPAGNTSGSSITQESSYELGFSAQGPAVVFVASEPITASASDWVAVPKNTALVVTREKGGFLNTLRCPLQGFPQPLASPAASLPYPYNGPLGSAPSLPPLLPRRSSGGGAGGLGPLACTDPQRDVCICLEALSRGITAKSRAFMVRRPTGLGFSAGSAAILQPAPDTLPQELPSMTSMTHNGFGRNSMGGMAGQPVQPEAAGAPGPAAAGPVAASRAGSQGLDGPPPPPDADTHDYMRLVGHTGPVMATTVCPHTARLYTASVDCSVRVWSLRDNSCLHTLVGQRKPVTAMRLRAHGRLLLAASGRKIRVWDAVGFRCLQLIKISDSCGTIRCLEVRGVHHHHHHNHAHGHNHDGRHHSSGHHNHVQSHAAADGGAHDGEQNAAAVTPRESSSPRSSISGDVLLSPRRSRYSSIDGGSSSSLSLAEILTMQEGVLDAAVGPLSFADRNGGAAGGDEGAQGPNGSMAPANSGLSLLYVGCQDTTVKVFTLDEHQLLAAAAAAAAVEAADRAAAAAQPPQSPPSASAANAPSGVSRQPSASAPPRSPFRPPVRPGELTTRTSTTGVTGPPALLPPRIISTPEEPDAGISDLAPLMVTAAGGGAHVGPVNCLALCGRYLCSGGGDATVRVWDSATLKLVGVLRGHRGSVLCLLGLGSSLVLSGARDNTIRVWDLEMDMMCRRTLTGHKDDVTGLAAITLHKRMTVGAAAAPPASGSGGWAVGSYAPPSGFLTPGGRSVALASTVVASSSADGTVRLWSTAWTCLCILSLPVPTGPTVPAALCACLSPDMAMAGYTDGELRLWHIEDVHGAVLQRCYSDVAAAAEALQAACGCVVHGSAATTAAAAAQGALAHVQQHGAAGAVAAAAALSDPSCKTASGITAALALLSARSPVTERSLPETPPPEPSAAAAATAAAAQPAAPELPLAAHPSQPPQQQPSSPMLQSPSLAHLIAGSNRPDSRASNASAGSGGRSGYGSDTGAAGVDLAPRSAQAQAQQQSGTCAGSSTCGAACAATCGDGAAPGAGAGCAADAGACCAAAGTGPGALALLPAGGSSVMSLGAPALPSAGPSTASAAVPIHIHGRRSPLSHASVANMAALAARVPGGGSQGGAPCGQLPLPLSLPLHLPLPLGGAHFCSTSDQQLEAALRDFVRIKTVSSSPKLRDDCHKGAKFLAKMLEGLGADVKVVQVYEDKNPVVIGRLGRNPDRPTVAFYGHYDVQPATEPDWATNPFELNSVNEFLYGRGVSDNKGPILAFIFAVRELMNACGDWPAGGCGGGRLGGLPVNVAFVFEGEEENGSRGFAQAVTQNLSWFEDTQLIIISNTLWVGENVPCLTYGMRGMLSLTVQITGPERDLHSGNDGGVFAEPMVDLLRVMATLIGPGGRVQVPGFYDDVEPGLIELAWTSLEESEEFSLEGYKAALGVPALTAPPNKRDLLVTRWCRPSLSVVDMRPCASAAGQQAEPATTCYRFGPTRFSVIPKAAQGKVSVRFVPNQDADQLVACLREHVQRSFASLGSSNRIDLHVEARGNWWEARQRSPWLAMAEAAIHKEWGVHPLYVREGGTMPVASYLERLLSAPAIMIPMGQSSDNCHLANERIRRTNLFKGKNVIRRLLEEIAAMGLAAAADIGSAATDVAGPEAVAADADGANGGMNGGWGAPTACAGLAE